MEILVKKLGLKPLSYVVSLFVLTIGSSILYSLTIEVSALAQTTSTAFQVPVNFENILVYDRGKGVCVVVSRNAVRQISSTCRNTWTQIVYTANKVLFYDRNAGEIEVYNIGQNGLGSRLQRFTNAQHRVRKTWAQITSPQEGVITFRDDSGQEENYRLTNSGTLVRI